MMNNNKKNEHKNELIWWDVPQEKLYKAADYLYISWS